MCAVVAPRAPRCPGVSACESRGRIHLDQRRRRDLGRVVKFVWNSERVSCEEPPHRTFETLTAGRHVAKVTEFVVMRFTFSGLARTYTCSIHERPFAEGR